MNPQNILGRCLSIYALLLTAFVAQAQPTPLAWFKLDEGSIDTNTNTVWDTTGTYSGTFNDPAATDYFPPGGTNYGDIEWVTNGLGPVPSPGTTAAIRLTAVSNSYGTNNPSVVTTLMTEGADGNGLAGAGAKTIVAWVKPDVVQNNANPTMVHFGPAFPNGARVSFKLASSGGGWVSRVEVQGGGFNGTVNVADGNWHQVAVVIPANAEVKNCTLYVDGSATGTPSGTTSINVYTNFPVIIGATTGANTYTLNGDRGFCGLIDDVRIYNTALSASDILSLYVGAGTVPSITALNDQSLVLGSTNTTVTFTAGALGTPPLQIQWKHNGIDLPGETNDSLTISPAGLPDLGTYTVAVTNSTGGTDASATLALNTAPINPPRQAVLAGQPATFTVSMPADSTGYTYQWRTNGVDISGATSSNLLVGSASAADEGTNYQVVVTLDGNSVTSTPSATLSVLAVPSSEYAKSVLESVPAGYWRLGEVNGASVAVDQTGFYPGTYVGYTGSQLQYPGALTGDSDTASYFNGANYVQVGYDDQLTQTNDLTLETWVKPGSLGTQQTLIDCHGNVPIVGYALYISSAGQAVFQTWSSISAGAIRTSSLSGGTLATNAWFHIVATYDGTTQRLYVNGVLVGTQTALFYPATGLNLRFGAGIGGAGTIANALTGEMDEVAIYRRVLSADEVQSHYLTGVYGTGAPVSIITQPADQQFILGDTNATVTFSVAAGGTPPLSYQWTHGVADVPGGTNATLTIHPASGTDIGTYSVTVNNPIAPATSDNATLSYKTGPVSPGAQTVLVGASPTITLTGMPDYQTYTYQWKHEGTNLPGATAVSLTLNSVTAADDGSYSVVVSLGADSVESDPATLTVLALPTQVYTEVVSNDTPVAWWRLDEPAGSYGATDLIGSRYASSSFGDFYGDIRWQQEGALLGDNDTAALFTGYSAGGRQSHPMLDVPYDSSLNAPTFSAECWVMPKGNAYNWESPLASRDGSSGNYKGYAFYVNPSGSFNFQIGTGTNWITLTGPVAGLDEWAHLVGTYDGTNADFYVNGTLVDSIATSFMPNTTYGLRIGAGATENPAGNYFWPGLVDEVTIYTNALSTAQVQAHYAAAFPSVATPRITLQPRVSAALAGGETVLSAKAHSTPPVSYQWQHAGTNVPGATSATLVLNPVAASDAGSYQVVATHGASSVNSSLANLSVLPGQAVSVNIQGYASSTVAANGGVAGYVAATNWNDVAYSASFGSVSGLHNNLGQSSPITVSWTAYTDRRWYGPVGANAVADYVLQNGFLDGGTGTNAGNIVVTVSNIPASYQSAGYSVYVYLGAPGVNSGLVDSTSWYGAVSVGGNTNYYHGIDLATWGGDWVPATETDPNNSTPADANYAVFTGLTSSNLQIVVGQHPLGLTGPPSLSGFQIVSDAATVATNPTNIAFTVTGNQINLSWPGDHLGWVLQMQTNSLSAGLGTNWVDVPGSSAVTSTTITIDPTTPAVFYRLRQ